MWLTIHGQPRTKTSIVLRKKIADGRQVTAGRYAANRAEGNTACFATGSADGGTPSQGRDWTHRQLVIGLAGLSRGPDPVALLRLVEPARGARGSNLARTQTR